jgi:hypothetical protein
MAYLFLPALTPAPLRQETDDEAIATLIRKGWQETTPPTPVAGQAPHWDETEKAWSLVAVPPPEPDYAGLWDAILISPVYQTAILPQSMTSIEVNNAATLLGLAMALAVMGRPNDGALAASLGLILTTATLTTEQIEEIVELLAQHHLSRLLPPPSTP